MFITFEGREMKYISVFWMLVISSAIVECYNIEMDKVGMAKGPEGTQFGYSVAIVRDNNKHISLLVGGPNATVNGISAHGEVQACNAPNQRTVACEWLLVTDVINKCNTLRAKDQERSHCEKDSRLGATIAVNRNYPVHRYTSTTIPMVTVCAPGWKNVYVETTQQKNYMIGMCLKLDGDLKSIPCDIDTRNELAYCWPFWAGSGTTHIRGSPVYTFAEGGMSATYTTYGEAEIIGGPGADMWRGAYRSPQRPEWVRRLDYTTNNHSIYYGYALATGRILSVDGDYIAAGVPNYYEISEGHLGRVEILQGNSKREYVEFGVERMCEGIEIHRLYTEKEQEKLGSKFGAVLAATDITGDYQDELLVGAPLYSGTSPEEGRVFVYTSKNQNMCGPIAILTGSANKMSQRNAESARFGSAIAGIGDIDKDGIQDFAVGAPYEDAGSGAVYIYMGPGRTDRKMEDVYAQRIAGKQFSPDIQSFGWSMYGNEDLDGNTYPDFAVGAYASDTAFVFRTRPIVKVGVTMQIDPSPIPLNATSSSNDCSKDGRQLCFTTTVVFIYEDRGGGETGDETGDIPDITVSWTLDADSLYKEKEGNSRVVFRDNGESVKNENFTIRRSENRITSKTYILDVLMYNGKPEPKDAWTKLEMKGTIAIVEANSTNFNELDPILEKDNERVFKREVEFDKKCESLDKCTSNLDLDVEMFLLGEGFQDKVLKNTTIYVGAANELLVTMDVKNLLNSSYKAKVSGLVTADMKRDKFVTDEGAVGATCMKDPEVAMTDMNCTANSKLDYNENFRVTGYFDISRAGLIRDNDMDQMRTNISINVVASQANPDTDLTNNAFYRSVDIKLKYDIHIQEDKDLSDQVRYNADEKSTREITLIHKYYIKNKGPSFMPKTYVNITIPVKKGDLEIAYVKGLSSTCGIRGQLPQIDTTTVPSTTTRRITIVEPEKQRRRKRAADAPHAEAQQGAQQTADKNITCGEYECVVVECKIINLMKGKQETVNVTINLFESALATEKDARQIHYATNATVTDPAVWFGGKVVPWDTTVYAEKWTLLVVDTATVVTETNIWIIIGAVLGAVALLIIVGVILWKCGFFKRKKHSEVQKWKNESLYKRRSQMRTSVISGKSQQPYNAIEDTGNGDSDSK